MQLIKVKISKDKNMIKYIKIIREFDRSISMASIKQNIDLHEPVVIFDMDGNDWIHDENVTEYDYHCHFYEFLERLIKAGAKVEIIMESDLGMYGIKEEVLDMKSLKRVILFEKEIWDDIENNPD